jgi:signal transduction histidine kinase
MASEPITVLFIEDDEDDYILTSQLLKEAEQSFEIEWQQTLASGIQAVAEKAFDVVILDLTLPDSTGRDTFTTMREKAPDLPIILMTGLEDNDLALQAVQQGAQDYLVKGSVGTDVMVRSVQYAIERKAADTALHRYKNQLEDLVQERTEELVVANRQLTEEIGFRKETEQNLRQAISKLEEHDRAKTQFVTNVSHELKTPLASMSYAVENLLKGVMGEVPDRIRTYLEMVRDDAQRLHRTISDILDLSRLEADTLKLEQAVIPFGRFVRRTLDAVALEVEERSVSLQVAIPDAVGFAACDATKMERVILNVVRNAITYTDPDGTIEVSVSRRPSPEDMLCVTVTDAGIGIPEIYIEKVTERYFRVGDHIDGMGLGLSIAKEIIELHGGTIGIKSPPPGRDQGTQVSISLPAVQTPPAIVTVDDDPDVLDLIEAQLTVDGYTVVKALNPRDAVSALHENRADILLVDLVMPDIRGDAVIAEVKADHGLRRIPIVVLTGSEIDRDTRYTLERFSVPALAKPWKQEALLDAIESAIIGKHYLAR